MPICVIMQGIPGSGKSFIANIVAKEINANIHSTDSFFYRSGEYVFDVEKLETYHLLNLSNAIASMAKGENVIIDNTNILQVYANPYITAARKYGYKIQFIQVSGDNFGNTHNVPEEIINKMTETMERLTIPNKGDI